MRSVTSGNVTTVSASVPSGGKHGIREQRSIHAAVVLILLQCREVLAVFNDHTRFLPSVGVKLHREVIPLEFTMPLR